MTDKIGIDEINKIFGNLKKPPNPEQEKIAAMLRTLEEANNKIQKDV